MAAVAIQVDFFAALVGVNVSVFIAAAVESRSVGKRSKKVRRTEGPKAARMTVMFASLMCVLALTSLAWGGGPSWLAWLLLVPTVGGLACLYLLFFAEDHKRANEWLARRTQRFWIWAWVLGGVLWLVVVFVGAWLAA